MRNFIYRISRSGIALGVILATPASLLLGTSVAEAAPISYEIRGGGYGHGIGMSQWGANGMAQAGHTPEGILGHYYRGTSVASHPMRPGIRVGLLQGASKINFRSAGGLDGTQGHFIIRLPSGDKTIFPGDSWEVRAVGSGWQVFRNGTDETGVFTGSVRVYFNEYNALLKIDQTGNRYRWGFLDLVQRPDGGYFDAVLEIGSYEKYLYGLGEVPSSWPEAALRAQAIAGRTYALEKANRLGDRRYGCSCTVYSSVSDQNYIGYEKEVGPYGSRWVGAVEATAGRVITHNGVPIQAYYSSSSGGHTENNEFVWGGSPIPYLRGVPDPYDSVAGNANASWSFRFTATELESRLNSDNRTAVGTLYNVQILEPVGVSGRVGTVIDSDSGGLLITGSNFNRRIAGSTFQSVMGLKSTLFSIHKTFPHPDGTFIKSSSDHTVWLLRDGIRWPFASPAEFLSRAGWSEVVTVSEQALGSYPVAGLGFRDGSLLGTPDGSVYLVSDGRRRHVKSPEVLVGLGMSFASVKKLSYTEAAVHTLGADLGSTTTVPDGMLVRNGSTDPIYMVDDGKARHIETFSQFATYRVPLSEVAALSSTQFSTLAPGPNVGFRDGTLIRTPDAKTWAMADGVRRLVSSSDAFNALGYQNEDVIAASPGEAAVHPEGPPLSWLPHPNGAILQVPGNHKVWILKDGIRWPVASPAEFLSRASWSEVTYVSAQMLDSYPAAGPGFREGSLISAPDGKVFLISDNKRRHITSPEVFYGLGLSFSNVKQVSYLDVARHVLGSPIDSFATIPDGMMVRRGASDPIYLVDDGKARHLPGWSHFASYRVSLSEVAVLTPSQSAQLPPGADLGFRDGSLIHTSDGKVWVISHEQRRWVSSYGVFVNLGYSFGNVIDVSDTDAQVHPVGEPIS